MSEQPLAETVGVGDCVEFNLFGDQYAGRVERITADPQAPTLRWAFVRLPQERVIGGVGAARDFVEVAPRIVTVVRCRCACHLTTRPKSGHVCSPGQHPADHTPRAEQGGES